MNKKHIGSTLDSFLEEMGILDQVRAGAQRKILAYDIATAMKEKGITHAEMARRMGTTRAAVYRVVDLNGGGITLDTIERASAALGMDFVVQLIPRAPAAKARRPRKTHEQLLAKYGLEGNRRRAPRKSKAA